MMDKSVGSRAEVMHGHALRTSGGLAKSDLVMKDGRIISKKKSEQAKNAPHLKAWTDSVEKAKKKLKMSGGFELVKGKLETEAKKLYKKEMKKVSKK